MSDSDLNTSPDGSLYVGEMGTRDVWSPVFIDDHGNEYIFLYADTHFTNKDDAETWAVEQIFDMLLLGLRFIRAQKFPAGEPIPNVTCIAKSRITGAEYKVAIINGPVFDRDYVEETAEENDRATFEARTKVAQENLDADAR